MDGFMKDREGEGEREKERKREREDKLGGGWGGVKKAA
jgi:hypothetical protein